MKNNSKGYWKIETEKYGTNEHINWWHECSNCGGKPLYNSSNYQVLSRFCPWCGEYMNPELEEMIDEEWMW